MTSLQGVWSRALEEFREVQKASQGPDDPESMFCLGYTFGVAFGLALSTVRPDLVGAFEPQFRKRGWLKEHEGYLSNEKTSGPSRDKPSKRRPPRKRSK